MLHNGDAPWTAPVELSELIETGIARPFLPSFSYYKMAENEFPQAGLERTRNLIAGDRPGGSSGFAGRAQADTTMTARW
ncbi:MAG: hypothetical protein ACOYM2_10885, partial [Rectinemataceae bacterium]